MIWCSINLGIGMATFVAWAVAFLNKPGAGVRTRDQPPDSVIVTPCCFPAGPHGRGNVVPAPRAGDLAQGIDHIRDYRQNRADFGAAIKILPDLREEEPPPRSKHAEAEDAVDRV